MRGRILLLVMALTLGACPLQRSPDPFAEFRAAVTRHFAPVAARFALGPAVEKKMSPELYIEFRGPAGRLVVAHELGVGPWVYVAVTTVNGLERQFGLHTIVEHREGSTRSFDATTRVTDLDAEVRMLAELTSKHAGSLLKERTANLRELDRLSQRALRERERKEGLDRPLEHLTLSQIFQLCKDGQPDRCAYSAVVGYDYPTDQVAAFLGVESDRVRRMIDDTDTIRPTGN